MYSLVMMMALSTSAEMPANHGCNGCSGCYGCNGCYGGCNGCNGGGHGCFGGKHKRHGCHGCNGCNGGCYGSCTGGYGCNGAGCYGSCTGGYGCNGAGCYGTVVAPAAVVPAAPVEPKKVAPKKAPDEAPEAAAASATIVVSLPADAKLSIDDRATASKSTVRTFATPTLETGKEYYYTLKAEVVRDGKTLVTSQKVAVRAGATSRITLDIPAATEVASAK